MNDEKTILNAIKVVADFDDIPFEGVDWTLFFEDDPKLETGLRQMKLMGFSNSNILNSNIPEVLELNRLPTPSAT